MLNAIRSVETSSAMPSHCLTVQLQLMWKGTNLISIQDHFITRIHQELLLGVVAYQAPLVVVTLPPPIYYSNTKGISVPSNNTESFGFQS